MIPSCEFLLMDVGRVVDAGEDCIKSSRYLTVTPSSTPLSRRPERSSRVRGRRRGAGTSTGDHDEVHRLIADLPSLERHLAVFHRGDHRNEETERVVAARMLLDAGCPGDVEDPRHHTIPLHHVAWLGFAEIVDLLLDRGATWHAAMLALVLRHPIQSRSAMSVAPPSK